MSRTEYFDKAVQEQGSCSFKLVFKDEDNFAVTPTSIYYDLSALDGAVVLYNQSVAVPAATCYITLNDSALRILEGEESRGERLLTIRATYNSSRGTGLKLNKQIGFNIQNLHLVGYQLEINVVEVVFTDDYPRDVVTV